MTERTQAGWIGVALGLVAMGILACAPVRAQEGPLAGMAIGPGPDLDRSRYPNLYDDANPNPPCPACRFPRVHLYHMPSGFLSEPIGLDSGDDPEFVYEQAVRRSLGLPTTNDGGNVQVWMGMDNPYFDYRRKDDPGGVGYYRIESQVQVIDHGKTSLAVGLQTHTPAGLEAGGVQDGPTAFSPNLALFHELGPGLAMQGFVSKTVRARAGWTDSLESNFQYGMAVQCALPGFLCPNQSIQLFVEALGRYRGDMNPNQYRYPAWEVFPGIHWRVGDRWWLQVGAARKSLVTWGWQF